jgi:hypothetical protein
VTAVYEGPDGAAVRGRLLAPGGERLLTFVDLFAVEAVESADTGDEGPVLRITRVETFARD